MRELVRVVTLVTVYHCNSVSDKLVRAVVAGTRAHLGEVSLFDDALARPVLVVDAVVRLGHV